MAEYQRFHAHTRGVKICANEDVAESDHLGYPDYSLTSKFVQHVVKQTMSCQSTLGRTLSSTLLTLLSIYGLCKFYVVKDLNRLSRRLDFYCQLAVQIRSICTPFSERTP